jgi:starch phosphorylase
MTAEEVVGLRRHYNPWEFYRRSEPLRRALDLIRSGFFSYDEPRRFEPLVDALLPKELENPAASGQGDDFFVLADFDAYAACQARVEEAFADQARWARMAILNIAHMGYFSSDRSVGEYAERIWHVKPIPIPG